MGKRLIFIFVAVLSFFKMEAQINYVLNPGFEDHAGCPVGQDQIKLANYWQPIDSIDIDPLCSPEYINACAGPHGLFGVPGVEWNHYTHSGKGMADAEVFYDESHPEQPYHRDYLQGHLSHPLTAGQSYCVNFYIFMEGAYGINHIGAYLDNGAIDTGTSPYCAWEQTEYTPQILELNIIKDTVTDSFRWHKIEGSFTATGNERFITIGNFFSKTNTSYVLQLPPQDTIGMAANGTGFSWALVDDVSVIASNSLPQAGNDTTIHAGDSAFIGPHEIALPYYWYVQGGTSPVDSGGGIFVHPDTTISYILQQTLCGLNTYDTVKVTVIPGDTVNSVNNVANRYALIYPNPAQQAVTISNIASGTEIRLFNIIGQEVLPATITSSSKQMLDVSNLPYGTYILQLQINGNITRKKIVISR